MAITGARVLIVDDDPASRRLLHVRLRSLDCQVVTAADGEEGLRAISRDAPDLILLDLQMPRMDGMEVLRALRKEGINVPTIVITAHGSIDTAVEAMKELTISSRSLWMPNTLTSSCARPWKERD